MTPRDRRAAAIAIIASILAVTAFIVFLDVVAFRAALPEDYVAFYTSPLLPRTFVTCVLAALDEVQFRLILMSLLVIGMAYWRGAPLSPFLFVVAILLSQLANVGALVVAEPLYASLRFWAVGCLWGWLYWRHGWLSALIGHGASHLVLDPALAFALGRF